MKILMLLILTFSFSIASAEIYKCKAANGTLMFTDKPCGKDAEIIQVKNDSSGLNMSGGDFSKITESNRSREQSRDIARIERYIAQLENEKREKLYQLDRRARYANNNLAGATYLESIATEKQSVVDNYNSQIGAQLDIINRLSR